jgi:hypothetical protein
VPQGEGGGKVSDQERIEHLEQVVLNLSYDLLTLADRLREYVGKGLIDHLTASYDRLTDDLAKAKAEEPTNDHH